MEQSLIADRYRLLDVIGIGGEARVFRARDLEAEADVAVRVSLRPDAKTNFASPVEFHPGWVKLLASGVDASCGPYQVFELLGGETLQEKVKQGRLDDGSWLAFIQQSLNAVEALHAAGWVHGDLNAENFMQENSTATWKLLELPFLGFAPPEDRSALFGAIHSLAPEQLQGRPADSRSDIYALGVLYYYAASGKFPHSGSTRQEVVISLLRFPPVPLREKDPARPGSVAEWVMRLLERDPQRRFPTIAEARRVLPSAPSDGRK